MSSKMRSKAENIRLVIAERRSISRMIAGIKQVHLVDVHIAAGEGKVETISTELLGSLLEEDPLSRAS